MRKGERTKKMILQKAATLFNQKGYVSTSMADVMNETGLERGGLYNHFSSRDELALQAFQHSVETMGAKHREIFSQKNNAIDRLLALIHVFGDLYENDPIPGGCPIMNAAIETDGTHPVLKEQAKQAMDRLHRTYSKAVSGGIEQGEVKPDVQADQVATILISSLEGALMLSRLYQDRKHLDQMIAHLQDFIHTHIEMTSACP
jgi:TetR/AcrR family transcriptional repressor of nem operon